MFTTEKTRKAINFDLDTKALDLLFGNNYHSKYKKIERDLDKLGFVHRQGSGYVSLKELSDRDVEKKIKQLTKQNPWLATCSKVFDITNVGEQYSVLNVITTTAKNLTNIAPLNDKSQDKERER